MTNNDVSSSPSLSLNSVAQDRDLRGDPLGSQQPGRDRAVRDGKRRRDGGHGLRGQDGDASFPLNTTTMTIPVTVNGDTTVEGNETSP
jgi:hypothetical protein